MRNRRSSQQPYVIVVEQRDINNSFLQFNCRRAGCEVGAASSGDAFVRLIDARLPDVFVFDWSADPGLPGELFSFIRRDELLANTPVLHYGGARIETELDIRIAATVCGETFSNQLLAIIEAQISRRPSIVDVGGIHLDVNSGRVTIQKQDLKFGATEVRLLAAFLANPDIVLNRSQLLDRVWGRARDVEERTVDVHVSRIRNRLRPYGLHSQIQTVRGVGYRFVSDVSPA